jgi:hypothetical protein
LDGGALQTNGAILGGLAAGSHTVSFNTVSGWVKPADLSVSVTNNQTNIVTGTYVPAGSLQVMLAPPGAVLAGAHWEVEGGLWQTNAAIVSGLAVGSHAVSFTTVSEWTTPTNQSVTIASNQTTVITANYTPPTVVTNADLATLQRALAGGGTVDFACDGTIILTNTIVISNHTVLDATGHQITLSGGSNVQIFVVNSNATLELNNLTLADGLATQMDSAGGAISNGGVLRIMGCTFSNNSAVGYSVYYGGGSGLGGAIFNEGSLIVSNSVFTGNHAMGSAGASGFIFADPGHEGGGGAIYNGSTALVANCIFSSNAAVGGTGGAGPGGYGYGGQPGGQANGGAICNIATLSLAGSTLLQNTVTGGAGGAGGYGAYSGVNYAGGPGGNGGAGTNGNGGAFCSISGIATIVNSTFAGNAAYGGAGGAGGSGAGPGGLSGTQGGAGGNGATGGSGFGGGISLLAGALSLTNVTLADNLAVAGAGGNAGAGGAGAYYTVPGPPGANGVAGFALGDTIANTNGALLIKNSILDCAAGGTNAFGPIVDAGYNLNSDGTGVLTDVNSLNNANPLLGTLGYYGGPTPTIPLLTNSPAIDAADPVVFPPADQRGFRRPYGAAPDIGAFEYIPPSAFPQIAAQPVGQTNVVGSSVNFSVTSGGAAPLTYQWFKNSQPLTNGGEISGVASATLAFSNVTVADTGLYSLTVSNLYGISTSADAVLEVRAAPTNIVTDASQAALVRAIAIGGTVTFNLDGVIGLTNTITISNTTVLDATGHNVTISGSNAVRLFQVNAGVTFSATNLVLANGQYVGQNVTASQNGSPGEGGAIFADGGTVQLVSCTVESNAAVSGTGVLNSIPIPGVPSIYGPGTEAHGGAIFVRNGSLLLDSVNLFGNEAAGTGNSAYGGAVFVTRSSALIRNCTLSGNFCTARADGSYSAFGGAAFLASGTMTISNCVVNSNAACGLNATSGSFPGAQRPGAAYGGGIAANSGTLTLALCQITSNLACGGNAWRYSGTGEAQGGGIYSSASVVMTNCTVANNQAESGNYSNVNTDGQGGGFYNFGPAAVSGCSFYSNVAVGGTAGNFGTAAYNFPGGNGMGGAVCNVGEMAMTNCTLSLNLAEAGVGGYYGVPGDGLGGGIYNGNGTCFAINVTLASNMVSATGSYEYQGFAAGASVANSVGTFALENSIIAYPGTSSNAWGTITDSGFNISSDGSAGFNRSVTSSLNNTDPMLGAFGNYGGPTQTMPLLVGSPAIDAVNSPAFPPTDQRGIPRPYGLAPDIGAIEYVPSDTPPQITMQPTGQIVVAGSLVTISTTTISLSPAGYQWYLNATLLTNSANISGVNTSSLTICAVALTDAGTYRVVVTNAYGSVTSDSIYLEIGAPPVISIEPAGQTNAIGVTATFSVAAGGVPPPAYQWFKNAMPLSNRGNISGVNHSNLVVTSAGLTNGGSYSVVVTNGFGAVTSAVAVFDVGIPPAISAQPTNRLTVWQGRTINLNVTASGTGPFNYQWMLDGTNIAGATASNYTFIVQPINSGSNLLYSVLVSSPFDSVLSSNADVIILRDRTAPGVTIASPAANVRTATPVLSGAATDQAAVAGVTFWITNRNIGIVVATGEASLSAGTTNVTWSITNLLLPGSNILAVQSRDFASNRSPVVSRSFFYKVPSLLTVSSNGRGTGSLAASVSFVGEARPTNGALLNVGESYTLTATAGRNCYFSNWTGTFRANVPATSARLSFIMESNTTICANFVTNLFIGMAGVYNGLFFISNDVAWESAGMLSGLTVRTSGAYSGTVLLGGHGYSLGGTFDMSGGASNHIARGPSQGGPVNVTMNLEWNNTPRQVLGFVSGTNGGPWTASLTADAAGSLRGSGEFTLLLSPLDQAIGVTPPGGGYGLLTNHLGTVTISGALADGTAYSQNVPLSETTNLPLYAGLTNPPGLLLGWVNLGGGSTSGNLVWIKKASRSPDLYTNGFTNTLSILGSSWTNPPVHTAAVSLSDGQLSLSGGGLTNLLTFNVSVNSNNTLVKLAGGPTNALQGLVNSKTGLLTVDFGTVNGKATNVGKGVMLQNTSAGGGYFLGRTNSGSIGLQP